MCHVMLHFVVADARHSLYTMILNALDKIKNNKKLYKCIISFLSFSEKFYLIKPKKIYICKQKL